MKPLNPILSLSGHPLKWAQSVHKALTGGIALASPTGKNAVGVYNEFSQDNGDGVMIRVGAHGTSEQQYTWGSTNTGIVINHGLLRQPIGYHVVDTDKALQVYRTAVPDTNQITLAPSDNSVNATIYIF